MQHFMAIPMQHMTYVRSYSKKKGTQIARNLL